MNEDYMRKWNARVKFCLKHPDWLTDWESAFVEDMSAKLERNQELSLKQSFKLGEIYHRIEGVVG